MEEASQDFKVGEKVTVLKSNGERDNHHYHGVRNAGKMVHDVTSLPVDCLRENNVETNSVASDRIFSARSEGRFLVF